MPLPQPHTDWPPRELTIPTRDVTAWGAWFGGDPDILSAVYGAGGGTREGSFERSFMGRGGLFGAVQRFFWGQPTAPGQQRNKLHVPVAAEIAGVSADLLFGAPPAITCDDVATQEVLDRLLGETAHTILHEGAETGSALGHTYFRVGVDKDIDDKAPLLSVVDADFAVSRYAYGRLVECTLTSEYRQGTDVIRHLEHHTKGLVEHGLYRGDIGNLGRSVPLDEIAETAELAPFIAEVQDGRHGIPTGVDRVAVVGIPNARTRTWRHIPAARYLGRSDIAGVEQDLDALDDVWTSWMRDIRHARSRLHVPASYLRSQGPGKGATFNLDDEIYVGVNSMPSADGGMEMTASQFEIRYAEHAATSSALLERIVAGAGYSPQTFGIEDTSSLTATESWARQIRTQNTRNAKIRRWRLGVLQLAWLLIEFDRVHFAGKGKADAPVQVNFQETVSESALARAQTAALLATAKAASIKTLVQMQHPDWDDDRVDDEVLLIQEETAPPPLEDPLGGFDDMENTDPEDPDAEGDPAEEEDPAAADKGAGEDPKAGKPGAKPAFGGKPAPGKPAGGKPAAGKPKGNAFGRRR